MVLLKKGREKEIVDANYSDVFISFTIVPALLTEVQKSLIDWKYIVFLHDFP